MFSWHDKTCSYLADIHVLRKRNWYNYLLFFTWNWEVLSPNSTNGTHCIPLFSLLFIFFESYMWLCTRKKIDRHVLPKTLHYWVLPTSICIRWSANRGREPSLLWLYRLTVFTWCHESVKFNHFKIVFIKTLKQEKTLKIAKFYWFMMLRKN